MEPIENGPRNSCTSLRTESAYWSSVQEKVTMAQLARRLGISPSTVSRALKSDPRISSKVRAEVAAAAATVGYRPNPMISALMSSRRRKGGGDEVGTIALVTDYHGNEDWRTKDVCRWEYEGVCMRAEETGYRVEEFPMAAFSHDFTKLGKVLVSRGIRGVLFGFSRERTITGLKGLELNSFSIAGLSTYFREVPLNRANFHGFHNVGLAMDELMAEGRKRIGLVVPEMNNRVSGFLWSGAALDWQRRNILGEPCVPFLPPAGREETDFPRWLKREKPDSLLVYKLPVKSWLSRMGLRVPEDVHVSFLYRNAGEIAEWPGIDGNLRMVGAAALDLVIEGLNTNRTGLPPYPKEVLIKGLWKASAGQPSQSSDINTQIG